MAEIIQIPHPMHGMIGSIKLEQQRDGWHIGFTIMLGADSPADGGCYSDGLGWPTGSRAFPSRREALYTAAEVIRERLPTFGLDCPSHNQRRKYLTLWLDKIAPAQLSLF